MAYKRIDNNDITALAAICGAARVHSAGALSEDYSHDELNGLRHMPEVMVEPVSTHEVSEIMKYAHERNIPVTARGQGTGLVGGAVALYGGILLNMCRMNRVVDLDEENLTLTVEPGVLLCDIYALVEGRGLFYPSNPGMKSATIGGNVSTNAGGMSAVKYGVTRDYVRGLEVVLADGTVIQTGGKIAKNSSGYSLRDMFIGAEGTLGIVTKIVLRLIPLPSHSTTIVAAFTDLAAAIGAVPEIIKSKVVPRSMEFVEHDLIAAVEAYTGRDFPGADDGAGAYLLLMLDGCSPEAVLQDCGSVMGICSAMGAVGVKHVETEEHSRAIWSAREKFSEAIRASTTETEECDLVVPRSQVADFILYMHRLEEKFGVRIKSYGHAGDGNLHLYILRDRIEQDEWEKRLVLVFDCMYRRAEELGGQISGEHGIGFAKRRYLEETAGAAVMDIMHRIKTAMDPKGILNPGKIVS